jgi:hypothetical protein
MFEGKFINNASEPNNAFNIHVYSSSLPIFSISYSTNTQPPNARINRARTQRRYSQVSRMKATLFALRLNELLGVAFINSTFISKL